MTDTQNLHEALLRPAVLHILRAAGFHSSKASVIDTLTDLCARHLLLLAERTAHFTYDRLAPSNAVYGNTDSLRLHPLSIHPSPSPHGAVTPLNTSRAATETPASDSEGPTQNAQKSERRIDRCVVEFAPSTSEVMAAMTSINFFSTGLTPSEEAWREYLRRPLSAFREGGAREKEVRLRDAEDTQDVREFIDWCTGDAAAEIRRIAGMEVKMVETIGITNEAPSGKGANASKPLNPAPASASATAGALTAPQPGEPIMQKMYPDDYLAQMKKKYSRTGDGARYAGTVLGSKHGRDGGDGRGTVRIEGGAESLKEWKAEMMKKRRLQDIDQQREADEGIRVS